jgi:DNA-binding MarR family transcriptional regulator
MRDPQIEAVLIALRRVMRATDLHSRELVRSMGLTAPQLLLLQKIAQLGQVGVGELAQEMSLSQATVTSILDRLEDRGYVQREKAATDKRKVLTALTTKGVDAIKDAPVPLQQSFVDRFRKLASWEQHQLIASMERVATMMDAQDMDASPVLDTGALDRQA